MTIWLNGERRDDIRATTLAELVAELGVAPQTVLLEHNEIALRPEEWPQRELALDDRIEMLRIVAGG